jgi:AraC-like DNA-binding protein
VDTPAFTTHASSTALRPYVGGYWLARGNRDLQHAVLPDGAVDVVLEVLGGQARSWVYGTSTRPVRFGIVPGAHYFGIRFRPGQARHFVGAPAHEMTDRRECAPHLLRFALEGAEEEVLAAGIAARFDRLLERHLARVQPERGRIDQAIDAIENGATRMADVAAGYGGSQRQFERVFRAAVGLGPKQFASVRRYRHAAHLIAGGAPLAQAAVDAGYTDQSHMSNEFRRLAGASPSRFVRRAVDFLQD